MKWTQPFETESITCEVSVNYVYLVPELNYIVGHLVSVGGELLAVENHTFGVRGV